ncbi:MAG: DUF1015 domain-containing protein [Clostridia bacterium]|nr:DUF1015 domain-containing protein [Clostridia bacterium]
MTVKAPTILLPNSNINLNKWAVVACDQFTSQPDYWDSVNQLTKGAYSTRHITLPEIYLPQADDKMINGINDTIKSYLTQGVLREVGECFILTVRNTPYTAQRVGLVLSVDLEDYDYRQGTSSLIRATEGTVIERIPPRVRIRKDALIELPHIMVLYDDPDNTVLNDLYNNRDKLPKLYDFDLMMNGGHIAGYQISNTAPVINKLNKLVKNGMLFAMGDGNHSLATAKAIWEQTKTTLSKSEQENHPARFALVEAVNLFDEGLVFEPIHRVVFNCGKQLIESLSIIGGERKCKLHYQGVDYCLNLPQSAIQAVKSVQECIDKYLALDKNASVDYVHGESDVKKVADQHPQSVAIVLPTLAKEDLFDYVTTNGVLPRKTFSMGEAFEKRYYLEAKFIKTLTPEQRQQFKTK